MSRILMSTFFLKWQSGVQGGVLNSNFAIFTTYIKSHTSLIFKEILSRICSFQAFLRGCVHVDVLGDFAMATFVVVYIAMARLILVLNLIKWTLIGNCPIGTLNNTNREGQLRAKE
jgi:hypothetical protein